MWTEYITIFQKYMGNGLIILWFMLALVYLFVNERSKPIRILFIYTPILVLLFYFNPLFANFFSALVGGEIYFRICWLLPVTMVIAYSILTIYGKLERKKGNCFLVAVAILVMISGTLVYTNPLFSKAENRYHVPQTVVRICDSIKLEGREVMAAFPEEFLVYVRQYSPLVCMPFGRETMMGVYDEMNVLMESEQIDAGKLAELAKEKGCHYLVLKENKQFEGSLLWYDYEIFDRIDGYVIYRDKTMNFDLGEEK